MSSTTTPITAALILAAGASRRFGGNKQMAIYAGKTLLANTIEQVRLAGCAPVFALCGFNAEQIMPEAERAGATPVYHKDWSAGMPSSLVAGLAVLAEQPDWEQLLIMPCDLPRFRLEEINGFKVAMQRSQSKGPVAIGYPEGPGLPLLLPRAFLSKHGYFANPKTSNATENRPYSLRQGLRDAPEITLLPPGAHTQDVDWPEDL